MLMLIFSVYTLVEAHLISDYLLRNAIFILLGIYLPMILRTQKAKRRSVAGILAREKEA